jgi:hypothetical protein
METYRLGDLLHDLLHLLAGALDVTKDARDQISVHSPRNGDLEIEKRSDPLVQRVDAFHDQDLALRWRGAYVRVAPTLAKVVQWQLCGLAFDQLLPNRTHRERERARARERHRA